MKIGIIGSGYVGLVTGTCFSQIGHDVICIDSNAEKIEQLKKGIVPIYEPGLKEIIKKSVRAKKLSFSTNISEAVARSKVLFICVNTPSKPNGEADLSNVGRVAKSIAQSMNSYRLVVEKSTVPVETGQWIEKTMKKYVKKGLSFDVASNPEFLREGCAVYDFLNPDRIVVGTETKKAQNLMKQIYEPIDQEILFTDIKSAELIKHASNSFLATKITFANALAVICDAVGADVDEVTYGMGLDKRIGPHFLKAGIGFGGSCFPKDLKAFIHIANKNGVSFPLLESVLKLNAYLPKYFLEKLRTVYKNLRRKRIAVLGLSFKPETDDMRQAPSIPIIKQLEKEGASVVAYDPQAMPKCAALFKKTLFVKNPYEAIEKADALLILTEWSEFSQLDLKRVKSIMRKPVLLDGRNIFNSTQMKKQGFKYFSMGRKKLKVSS